MHVHVSVTNGAEPHVEAEATLLRAAIADARRIALFTGAGLSTECGVPDFRSPGSPWMQNRPISFADFLSDPAIRVEAWRRKFAMDEHSAGAAPGRGHRALAAMVRSGKARGVITQNIDGLHASSGLRDDEIIELHGNGTYATCLDCGLRHELNDIREEFVRERIAPSCRECGGPVKSATISFGQSMPEAAMRQALEWAAEADLFLAIGSSLLVQPAARLPLIARRFGARLIIVNREATPLDEHAQARLRGDIGPLFDAAVLQAAGAPNVAG
jgi:NAD-dependent deacetylase